MLQLLQPNLFHDQLWFGTVCGFIAEVGDIIRFDNPKQLQKLAGYAIVSNNSGKHNGEMTQTIPIVNLNNSRTSFIMNGRYYRGSSDVSGRRIRVQITGKLTKPLTEVKYLNADNVSRYRCIMRIFFENYEKLKYWLYQEDVYEEMIKDPFFRIIGWNSASRIWLC